jgi:MerR family transcriptional regulator, heat shock protein HspR
VKQREPDTPVYVISIAADLLGVHPRTLRIYEERGLVSPVRRHRIRLYSERDIQRVRLIRFLMEERGLNLAGVRLLLEIQEHYHEELTWVFNEHAPGTDTDDGHGKRSNEGKRPYKGGSER